MLKSKKIPLSAYAKHRALLEREAYLEEQLKLVRERIRESINVNNFNKS